MLKSIRNGLSRACIIQSSSSATLGSDFGTEGTEGDGEAEGLLEVEAVAVGFAGRRPRRRGIVARSGELRKTKAKNSAAQDGLVTVYRRKSRVSSQRAQSRKVASVRD